MPVGIENLGGATRETQEFNIVPTLLIGLGGSGKEVLMRLRRLFYEKYRTPGLPVLKYLWFDTDISNVNIKRERYDELDNRLYFNADELIDASIESSQLDEYYRHPNVHQHIFRWFNRDALQPLGTDVFHQGAGGIRPFGRLAFFSRYHAIRNRITRCLRDLSVAAGQGVPGYTVEPHRKEIIIVGSLAGGTGSGAFLDFGFLCKEIAPDVPRTGIFFLPQVFQGEPNVDHQKVEANGFAALVELDYYLVPYASHTPGQEFINFQFEWEGAGNPVSISPPPYTSVYLLDNTNQQGAVVEDYTDVFQMAAEYLLFDFEQSTFSVDKRSNRTNLAANLCEMTNYFLTDENSKERIYAQYFPNRYSTFGLAQIQLNRARVANAAAYFFAKELVDFWLAPKNRVEHGFVYHQLLREGGLLSVLGFTMDRMIPMISQHSEGQTFYEFERNRVNERFGGLLEELARQRTDVKREELMLNVLVTDIQNGARRLVEETIQRVNDNLRLAGLDRGPDVKKLEENREKFVKEKFEGLKNRVLEMLCDPLQFGPNYVDTLLDVTLKRLGELETEVERKASEPLPALEPQISFELTPFIPPSEDGIEKYKVLLDEARSLPSILPRYKPIAVSHFKQRLESAQRVFQNQKTTRWSQHWTENLSQLERKFQEKQRDLLEWIRVRYEVEVSRRLQRALGTIKSQVRSTIEIRGRNGEVTTRVTGLQYELQAFRENLNRLQQDLTALFESYQRAPESGRNFYLSPELNWLEETEAYMRTQFNAGDDFDQIRENRSRQFFLVSQLVLVDTVVHQEIDILREGVRQIYDRSANQARDPNAWNEVRTSIERFVLEQFQGFMAEKNAVGELRRLYPNPEDRRGHLERLYRYSGARIQRAVMGDEIRNRIEQLSMAVIGMDPADEEITQSLGQTGANNPFARVDPRPYLTDALVLFYEVAAFPLFYVGGLEDLQRSYRNNLPKHPDNVYYRHSEKDYDKFRDILPPRTDEEALIITQNYEPFFQSLILGVVKFNRNDGFYRSYRDKNNLTRKELLDKNLLKSIKSLSTKLNIIRHLNKECDIIMQGWKYNNNYTKFYQYSAIMQYLWENIFNQNNVTVLNKPYHIFDFNALAIERLLGRVREEILKPIGHAEEKLNRLIQNQVSNIGQSTAELDYWEPTIMAGRIRVFRE